MVKITRDELEQYNELRRLAASTPYIVVSSGRHHETKSVEYWKRLREFEKVLSDKYGFDSRKQTIDSQTLEIVEMKEKVIWQRYPMLE